MKNFTLTIKDSYVFLTLRNVSKKEFNESEKEIIFSLIRCSMYLSDTIFTTKRFGLEGDSFILNISSEKNDLHLGIRDKIFRTIPLMPRTEKVASRYDIESEVLKVFPDFKL